MEDRRRKYILRLKSDPVAYRLYLDGKNEATRRSRSAKTGKSREEYLQKERERKRKARLDKQHTESPQIGLTHKKTISRQKKEGKKQAKEFRDKLQLKLAAAEAKIKQLQRRTRYLESKVKKPSCPANPNSPEAEVEKLLKEGSSSEIRKQLLTLRVLIKEKKKVKNLSELKGSIISKYRLQRRFYAILGKYRATHFHKKTAAMIRSVRGAGNQALRRKIVEFYEMEENSAVTPNNKGGFVTRGGRREKKRILLKSIKTLYFGFKDANPGVSVSFTTFWKNKPFYVVPQKASDRDTCKCKMCENVELLFKAARRAKLIR